MQAGDKRIHMGSGDFKELVSSGALFVDKSSFISELVSSSYKISVICRPRRFGKTLNLSMLAYFFDVRKEPPKREGDLFEGMVVMQDKAVMAYRASYPVISLSLAGLENATAEGLIQDFSGRIADLYNEYRYLYPALEAEEKLYFDKICSGVSGADLKRALARLIRFVSKQNGDKKVIVLLDEYEAPLLCAEHKGYIDEFGMLYRSFMSNALKDNQILERAVIAGIQPLSSSGFFSNFSGVEVSDVLRGAYPTSFGFTASELDHLLEANGISKAQAKSDLSTWYGGYQFGSSPHKIYNPYSVFTYIKNGGKVGSHWLLSIDGRVVQEKLLTANDSVGEELISLMVEGGLVSLQVPENAFLAYNFQEVNDQAFWLFLVSQGFVSGCIKSCDNDMLTVDIRMPNREVSSFYAQIFSMWVDKLAAYPKNFVELLSLGQFERICKHLEGFFKVEGVSPVQFVLGVQAYMSRAYNAKVHSKRYGDNLRVDMVFEPYEKRDAGIVFELDEFPFSPSAASAAFAAFVSNEWAQAANIGAGLALEASARGGVSRMKHASFWRGMLDRGIEKVVCIALAFSGKDIDSSFDVIYESPAAKSGFETEDDAVRALPVEKKKKHQDDAPRKRGPGVSR